MKHIDVIDLDLTFDELIKELQIRIKRIKSKDYNCFTIAEALIINTEIKNKLMLTPCEPEEIKNEILQNK